MRANVMSTFRWQCTVLYTVRQTLWTLWGKYGKIEVENSTHKLKSERKEFKVFGRTPCALESAHVVRASEALYVQCSSPFLCCSVKFRDVCLFSWFCLITDQQEAFSSDLEDLLSLLWLASIKRSPLVPNDPAAFWFTALNLADCVNNEEFFSVCIDFFGELMKL